MLFCGVCVSAMWCVSLLVDVTCFDSAGCHRLRIPRDPLLVGDLVSSHVLIDHVGTTCAHHGPRSETGVSTALSRWEIRCSDPRNLMVSDTETSNSHSYPLLHLAHPMSTFTQTRLPRISTLLLTILALFGAILYLVMKVQELGALLQERDDIIPAPLWEHPGSRPHQNALLAETSWMKMTDVPRFLSFLVGLDGVCERNTGGTCFLSGCLSSRNASCVTTWGLRTLPWPLVPVRRAPVRPHGRQLPRPSPCRAAWAAG